jgi:hypothetical protein
MGQNLFQQLLKPVKPSVYLCLLLIIIRILLLNKSKVQEGMYLALGNYCRDEVDTLKYTPVELTYRYRSHCCG